MTLKVDGLTRGKSIDRSIYRTEKQGTNETTLARAIIQRPVEHAFTRIHLATRTLHAQLLCRMLIGILGASSSHGHKLAAEHRNREEESERRTVTWQAPAR
jgi:hypothetical protein